MKDISIKELNTTYNNIRNSIVNAQNKIVKAINSAIVESYWQIGEQIYKECGENERAEYGKYVLQYLSNRLTKEFGKGGGLANLKNMRQFYLAFPKSYTLCSQFNVKVKESK